MNGMSEKVYLQLDQPTEEDFRSSAQRIEDALQATYGKVQIPVRTLRKLYPLCQKADWNITVTLAKYGDTWMLVHVEAGDTTKAHYGLAVDLGSTTVVMEAVYINTGKVHRSKTAVNGQVAYGNEILSRILIPLTEWSSLYSFKGSPSRLKTRIVRPPSGKFIPF